ncbi:hypothetical protein [Streptomyces sp. A1499]|uniref:hypothetical protein n=1 Tax=Streptomyces sp. A1499 TaxID=2563104 RepID=UPI00109E57B2|nr:hypothetical protein [Streptomyces sp. A1499]THC45948.1 hypothetical protein E7X58_30800 [Streptomyces sp. A1499]
MAYARILVLLALPALDEHPHLLTAWSRPVRTARRATRRWSTRRRASSPRSTTSPPTTPSPRRRAHAFGHDQALLRAARDVIDDQCRPGPW